MIRILAYIFALILMIISLFMAPVHLKTIPTYLKLRFTNFHTLLGCSLVLLTILSIIISVQTFIKPNLFWVFVALFFIVVNIWSWIYMMRSALKNLKQIYKEQKANKDGIM